ncbi:hypothetical protein DRF60_02105 [Chryseobacterium elymi]|uniref:Uncharacterized protein n=1 Tax=Chryseobacterium elymi TaxID=395936 RepID=A0A3D9DRV6_9FLAO|nr:hypothetical protein DRF60_02105 [Chryseobacterium elymi]
MAFLVKSKVQFSSLASFFEKGKSASEASNEKLWILLQRVSSFNKIVVFIVLTFVFLLKYHLILEYKNLSKNLS